MPIAHARADESGELVPGYFYELYVIDPLLPMRHQSSDWIVSDSGEDHGYAEVISYDNHEIRKCPYNPDHVSTRIVVPREVALYGDRVQKLISEQTVVLFDCRLATELEGAPLRGVVVRPVELANPFDFGRDKPKVFALIFSGCEVARRSLAPPEEDNHCPFCGFRPFFCPSCSVGSHECPRCHRDATALVNDNPDPADPRIRYQGVPPLGFVVEPRRWNGDDFLCGGGVITRRALDWLLSVHAGPFRARPLRTDVTGMTPEEWEHLEQAKILPEKP